MGEIYKETQIIKPEDITKLQYNEQKENIGKNTVNLKDLFLKENLYSSKVTEIKEGKNKTTITENITRVPKIIIIERTIPKKKDITKKEKQKEIKYIDVPIIHPRQEVCYQEISKNVPKGAELVVTQTLQVPKIVPKYKEITVPIYVPCYIEVPIPAQYLSFENGGKEYFTSGISDNPKFLKHPNFYNSSLEHSKNCNTPITMNKDLNISDEKSADFSSKCSIQNISPSEQKI